MMTIREYFVQMGEPMHWPPNLTWRRVTVGGMFFGILLAPIMIPVYLIMRFFRTEVWKKP